MNIQSENLLKKVSISFNGLGTRHCGGHSVIRKNGHSGPPGGAPVYKVNSNGPIKNGSNGLTDSIPASPCRTPTRRSLTENIRFSRESRDSQYGGNGKGQHKIESDRCTDRHLNMVILFFVLGVVICWVPYHIFQLLVSVSVQLRIHARWFKIERLSESDDFFYRAAQTAQMIQSGHQIAC